jgi:hypothetical protein
MIMSVRTVDPKTKIVSESYVGAVLAEYEDNGYHDSYGHAIVWDATTASVRTVATWSTAYYSLTAADTDATEETIMNAREYAAKILFQNKIKDHKIVGPGKTVRSLTTRGKAKGAVGIVLRFEDNRYARSYGDYRPQVAVVRVTDPENVHYGRTLYIKPDRLEVTDALTPEVENDYRQQAWLESREETMIDLFHPRWGAVFRSADLGTSAQV